MNESTSINLHDLQLHSRAAEFTTWQGSAALRLDGLALLPGLPVNAGRLHVEIAAEGTCYPGIAFRAASGRNFELAYTQPHTSGLWDAIQYDPVFNGSNTWQLYQGPAYQKETVVPTGEWFELQVDFSGDRAQIQVGDQAPLVVERLAHGSNPGLVGLWTYLPAYFRNFTLERQAKLPPPEPPPAPPPGALTAWQIEGFGPAPCEPDGFLNLNRYLPLEANPALLTHEFELALASEVRLSFGFSDELALAVDGQELFQGENLWKPSPQWGERGYVDLRSQALNLNLSPGKHTLLARLAVKEYFGWGLIASLLPA